MLAQIALLDVPRRLAGDTEVALHELADALLDHRMARWVHDIQRVVEVEYPRVHMPQIRSEVYVDRFRCTVHGSEDGRSPAAAQASLIPVNQPF